MNPDGLTEDEYRRPIIWIDDEINDFYRIKEIEEAFDFGFEEYLESGNYCFIEWPEKVENLLPENTLKVNIRVNEDLSRIISF